MGFYFFYLRLMIVGRVFESGGVVLCSGDDFYVLGVKFIVFF